MSTGSGPAWFCASVKFATTAGNGLRELVQQLLMVAQARAAGIELVPDNSPASVLFGARLGARQYELIMFTWLRRCEPAVGAGGCTAAAASQNHMGYCSPAVTDLGLRAEVELDPAVRAQLRQRREQDPRRRRAVGPPVPAAGVPRPAGRRCGAREVNPGGLRHLERAPS